MNTIFKFALLLFLSVSIIQAKQIDSFEKSSLHYFNGIYVLDLHGSREEMMFAHGYFANKNVVAKSSPIEFFASIMDQSLVSRVGSFGGAVASRVVGQLLTAKLSKEDDKAYRAFALGYGIPKEKVFKALMYPDFGEILASVNYAENKVSEKLPDLGCSTFVVPQSDQNPGLLFARNLEFGGVGIFDRYPAVVYLHSTDPDDIPYVQLTALGLPGTHTAYNQSGIMVSLHQLTINQYSLVGDLILAVVDEVARRAHTLEEAKAIIESKKFTTAWKLIVASEKQNSGFVAEVSPKGKYFNTINNLGVGETNHVSQELLKTDEFFTSYNYLNSSLNRKVTMTQALDASSVFSVDSALNLLGDRTNPTTHENSFISLSKFNNIMSVLFSTEKQELYFGVSSRINTKPSSGIYVRLPLAFNTNFSTYQALAIKPSKQYSAALLEVDHQIRGAMTESNQSGDLKLVSEYLKKAVLAYPVDTDLNNVYAAVLIKLHGYSEGKSVVYLEEATEILSRSKGIAQGKNQKAVLDILSARIAVLKGHLDDAKSIYEGIVPTTSAMKSAIAEDLKLIRSSKAQANILERSRKVKITLSDMDILDF